MIGAIIGDIVGSRFEFNNHRSKEFDLFHDDCQITDDSIMTLAVAKAIMETEKIIEPSFGRDDVEKEYCSQLNSMTITYMQEIGRKYPDCGYGGMFGQWVFSKNPKPYHSFGNGAAMRISPVGFVATSEAEACRLSRIVTGVTHNHEEGIKGAEATVVAIFMARRGYTKVEIRNKICENYYPLHFRMDEIRGTYQFNETCQETVPQAIEAFLESASFEDAIRLAISVGGDSDTLAAITGAIAEAYYGVPKELEEKALAYLDEDLLSIYHDWCKFAEYDHASSKFKVLTKYISKISETEPFGEWIIDGEGDGKLEHTIQMPFVHFNELVSSFVKEFYQFSESHSEYNLTNYEKILENNSLKWSDEEMCHADVDALGAQCILALIMGVIRADRFSEGTLLSFFNNGFIAKWLKRLKSIDDRNGAVDIAEIYFEIGGYGGYDTYQILFKDGDASFITTLWGKSSIVKHLPKEETTPLLDSFKSIQVDLWNSEYHDPTICDGTQWRLAVKSKGHHGNVWEGSNAYPHNWDELLSFFGIDDNEDD